MSCLRQLMHAAVSAARSVTCHKAASSKQHCLLQSPCLVPKAPHSSSGSGWLSSFLNTTCVSLKQSLPSLQIVMSLLLDKGDTLLAEEFTYPHVVESFARPRGYKVRPHHSLHTMLLHDPRWFDALCAHAIQYSARRRAAAVHAYLLDASHSHSGKGILLL